MANETTAQIFTCVACKATGTADKMLNLPLEGRKVEQVVLCRPCGQDARAFGHEVYHLQATLQMIARRQAERAAAEATRQKASNAFFGKMGSVTHSAEEEGARQAAVQIRRTAKRAERDSRSEEWDTRRNDAARGYTVAAG